VGEPRGPRLGGKGWVGNFHTGRVLQQVRSKDTGRESAEREERPLSATPGKRFHGKGRAVPTTNDSRKG